MCTSAHEHFCKQQLQTEALCEPALCELQHPTCSANFQVKKNKLFFPQKFPSLKKKKKSFYFKIMCSGSSTEFSILPHLQYMLGYFILPGVRVITLENKPDVSFLESILSQYYFKETSTGNTLRSVNEGTFFVIAISFCIFTELMTTKRSCFQ